MRISPNAVRSTVLLIASMAGLWLGTAACATASATQTIMLSVAEDQPALTCTKSPTVKKPVSVVPQYPSSAATYPEDPPPALAPIPDLSPKDRLALPKPNSPTYRIGVWGDSHFASGAFQQELTKILEARGLVVRQLTIPASLIDPYIRLPIRKACASKEDWSMTAAYRQAEKVEVGIGLTSLTANHVGSTLRLDMHTPNDKWVVKTFRLRYEPQMAGTVLAVSGGSGSEQHIRLLDAKSAQGKSAELVIKSATQLGVVTIRLIEGNFTLQGLTLTPENEDTSVVLDFFGLPSSTAKGWTQADKEVLRTAIADNGYDLVMLEYGTNETANPAFDPAHYSSDMTNTLNVMRELFPTQSCLLIGPPDRGVNWSSAPRAVHPEPYFYARRQHEAASVQSQLAGHYNCGFWDWQGAMGGPGTSYQWSKASPPYTLKDLTHMTTLGYQWSAQAMAKFLSWYP